VARGGARRQHAGPAAVAPVRPRRVARADAGGPGTHGRGGDRAGRPARRRVGDRHRRRGRLDAVPIPLEPGADAAGRRRRPLRPAEGGTVNVDEQRRAAGEAAAALVRDGMNLGYGTGRAAAAALEALARRKLRIRGVPTSERTAELCRALGLPLTTLEET